MLSRVCHGALASPRLSPTAGELGQCRLINRNACSWKRLARSVSVKAKSAGSEQDFSHRQVSFSIYHNVQEGDTLTSIAKQYGTTVRTVALANRIEDVDVLQAGVILLVPVQPKVFQKVSALVLGLDSGKYPVVSQAGNEPQLVPVIEEARPISPVQVARPLGFWNIAKFAVPLAILAPILVLLFRYLLQAARNEIELQVSNKQAHKDALDVQRRPKLKRWQGVLDGDRETDEGFAADAQLEEATAPETEEERKIREEEELRQSYAELEATYIKFLADSGMAKSGYWRGGMPPANGDFG